MVQAMTNRDRKSRLALPGVIGLVGICSIAAAPTPGAEPAAAAAPADFDTARQLLEALEVADREIETLTADIQYDKFFKLQGDVHRRKGVLQFRTQRSDDPDEAPRRAFEINFQSLLIGDRLEEDPETWIFDGRWLVEMHPARKQFIKREIASDGARFDPLAIGEGPMPIPIGQKAGEVLARYDARLAPSAEPFAADEDARARFVADTWQLVLTPRANRGGDEKFKEIRIWYSRSEPNRLLPRMARTLARSGDVTYVQMINIRTGVGLSARAFDVSPPPPGEHWHVQIEPLPEPKVNQ